MTPRRAWLPLLLPCLFALVSAARAAELGTITLVDGAPKLLRGVTWYRVAPGVRVAEGDIVALAERGQIQVELATGAIVNLGSPGALYLASPVKGVALVDLAEGWAKVVARAPGLRLRTRAFEATTADAAIVAHADAAGAEVFVEAGAATLIEAGGARREAKRGEYWSRAGGGAFTTVARAPKTFVDAMPRPYTDPLPVLAAKSKSQASPVADRDVTYVEAAPWLDGPDRVAFERRFAARLKDPAFRAAAEPQLARHPAWDRQLHPEKYRAKEAKAP